MDNAIAFSGRSILAAAVTKIGGSDPVFVNVLGARSFRMRVSFSIPSSVDGSVVVSVVATGDAASAEDAAEQSACAAAFLVLWREHGYVVADYSIFRVWDCQERYIGLTEKLEQSRTIFEDVFDRSLGVFNSIGSVLRTSLQITRDMAHTGVDSSISGAAASCAGFLEMMHVRAELVREQAMSEFDAVNGHNNPGHVLSGSGFTLPYNNGGHTNLDGGLRMMLDRAATILGYDVPVSQIKTRGEDCRCFLYFCRLGRGQIVDFKTAGIISTSARTATESALYKGLLTLSVNRRREIIDGNRDAYLFAKGRVDSVSSDVVRLGNAGSSICSYFDSTLRGLNIVKSSHSSLLSRHPSGEEICRRLEDLISEADQCLAAITDLVRVMNENCVVALAPF